MFRGARVVAIIPALDEEQAIAGVLADVDREIVDEVIVTDNGSVDRTSEVAAAGGATVVLEPRQGYGSACLAALRIAGDADLLVFLDGDGSDDPRQIPQLLRWLLDEDADLVIGSRVLGRPEPGALTPVQRLGNALTCTLVRWFWGVRYTDLGPYRAIRREALARLEMADPDFGWTIEMQVKAAQRGLKTTELPVRCRVRQAGRSKISGTLRGSYRAGRRILGIVFAARAAELLGVAPGTRRY